MERTKPVIVLAIILALSPIVVYAQSSASRFVFSTEADDLVPLSNTATLAITQHESKGDYRECKNFKGKQVSLETTGKAEYWIAITADGCAWGAHSAEIWALKHTPRGYEVVLRAGGHTLKVLRGGTKGLRDIVSSDYSAGYYSETRYRYNGMKYVPVKERYVDLSNPTSCTKGRNRDVCPK